MKNFHGLGKKNTTITDSVLVTSLIQIFVVLVVFVLTSFSAVILFSFKCDHDIFCLRQVSIIHWLFIKRLNLHTVYFKFLFIYHFKLHNLESLFQTDNTVQMRQKN